MIKYLILLWLSFHLSEQSTPRNVVPNVQEVTRAFIITIQPSSYLDTNSIKYLSLSEKMRKSTIGQHSLIKQTYIDTNAFERQYQLSPEDIAYITNLINTKPEAYDDSQEEECHIPRHAIVFYDENNQLMAYIEFCFECGSVKYKYLDAGRVQFGHHQFAQSKAFIQSKLTH